MLEKISVSPTGETIKNETETEEDLSQERVKKIIVSLQERGEVQFSQDRGFMGFILGDIYFSEATAQIQRSARNKDFIDSAIFFESLFRGVPLSEAMKKPRHYLQYIHYIRNVRESYYMEENQDDDIEKYNANIQQRKPGKESIRRALRSGKIVTAGVETRYNEMAQAIKEEIEEIIDPEIVEKLHLDTLYEKARDVAIERAQKIEE